MRVSRKELLIAVGVVLLAWVALLMVLAKWKASRPSVEPELLHYPGTEGITEQESENLGFRKYWFTFGEPYPSKKVYQFYRDKLQEKGWRPVPEREPEWTRQEIKGEALDLFHAVWLAPNRLHQIDLDMKSVVKLKRAGDRVVSEEREPGIEVYVTLRRVMFPGPLLAPTQPEEPKGEIEVR